MEMEIELMSPRNGDLGYSSRASLRGEFARHLVAESTSSSLQAKYQSSFKHPHQLAHAFLPKPQSIDDVDHPLPAATVSSSS